MNTEKIAKEIAFTLESLAHLRGDLLSTDKDITHMLQFHLILAADLVRSATPEQVAAAVGKVVRP